MRIYVGTYAKYNSGSIAGDWLDLDNYSDKGDFYEACAELHDDEEDPEFMFQDWENIPDGMVSESHIDGEAFDLAAMDNDDLEMFKAYRSDVDQSGTFEQARDAYRGKYDSEKDFAEEYSIECGDIPDDHPMFCYIDFEHYWNGNLQHSFIFSDGFVFSRD